MEKRPFTLTACITTLVLGALSIIAGIFTIVFVDMLIRVFYGGDFMYDSAYVLTLLFTKFFMTVLMVLPAIVLSAILIACYKKPAEKFKKGVAIALFVIICAWFVLEICFFNTATILSLLILAMCGTFLMLDIIKCYKTLKMQPTVQVASGNNIVSEKNFLQTNEISNPIQNKSELSSLYTELQKLTAMFKEELITQEEFNKLKENLVNKSLKN